MLNYFKNFRCLIIGFVLIGLLFACEKKSIEPNKIEPPKFYIRANINGDSVNYSSGINNYIGVPHNEEADSINSFYFSIENKQNANEKYIDFVFFSKKPLTDPTSGFRLMDRKAMSLFARSYPADFPEPSSTALALRNGLKVLEVSTVMEDRNQGTSSIHGLKALSYIVRVLTQILQVKFGGSI